MQNKVSLLDKTTYFGSGAAVFFGLSANELAAVGGLILAVVSFLAAQYWNLRKFQQQERYLQEKIKVLRDGSQ